MPAMTFTESHLRRAIESAKGRQIAFHLSGGGSVRGLVMGVDKDQDGFIEIDLEQDGKKFRFVAPVENIVAYEVTAA